ncbi:MAG TPA: hypothetical protein VLA68_04485, partial [Nitrososphaera sp.]|nr:hypothetical protein [Nitrososphaera sp.]
MKMHSFTSIIISAILALAVSVPAFAQNEEHVQFVANIEFIKGHLEQAVANKQANDTGLAKAHSAHPIAEHYSLIEEEIEEHDAQLNTELKNALTALAGQVDSLSDSEFQTRVTEINGMLDKAKESAISAAERNDPKFNAAVTISILQLAEHEYEEAVENGVIKAMVEYQDATGFISRAKATYNSSVKAAVPEHEGEEIAEFFELLDTRIVAKTDFEEVENAIGGIVHELEEVFELEAEGTPIDGWGYIDRIKELLDRSLAEYKEGEFIEARSLAVEAYLENYEFIEADIEQDDPELMEKIELDLREELTQMIDDRKPAAEIEAHIEKIKTDLETARAVVTPEFP